MSTPTNATLLAAAAVALISLVPTAASAQTTANGPYYATPSWDQKLQCDSLSTCPRFVVLTNWNSEAVLDRETGLTWQRAPVTDVTVSTSPSLENACHSVTTGGRFGWRVPTMPELLSIFEPTRDTTYPYVPAGSPFVFPPALAFFTFITSTPADPDFKGNPQIKILVNRPRGFDKPTGLIVGTAGTSYGVGTAWCVRGPSSR
jgi:hypothetical protein